MISDITERKIGEDKIKSLLAEKEIILKEVHHRLKNNMSAVYALLTLQAISLTDTAAIQALEDAKSRVQSMLILYDKLYLTEHHDKISLSEYLPSLIDEILGNFAKVSLVRVEKKIDNIVVEAKLLQPLGILVNELLTNVMKYAFVGRDEGQISVFASLSNGIVELSIQDDGKGLPDSFVLEDSKGFGMKLVTLMAAQLNGRIHVEQDGGTKFTLTFPV